MVAEAFCLLRYISVVQCQGIALVLHNNARTYASHISELLTHLWWQRLCPIKYLIFAHAHFRTMPADRRQTQRREQAIKIGDRPATHQSDRTSHEIKQAPECFRQSIGICTSAGDGPISTMVPSTSSNRAI